MGWEGNSVYREDICQYLEKLLVVTTVGSPTTDMQWAETIIRLNILQCTGQIPTTTNYLAQNVNTAKAEKPYLVLFFKPSRYFSLIQSIFIVPSTNY